MELEKDALTILFELFELVELVLIWLSNVFEKKYSRNANVKLF